MKCMHFQEIFGTGPGSVWLQYFMYLEEHLAPCVDRVVGKLGRSTLATVDVDDVKGMLHYGGKHDKISLLLEFRSLGSCHAMRDGSHGIYGSNHGAVHG
jgi:hypothetical protein